MIQLSRKPSSAATDAKKWRAQRQQRPGAHLLTDSIHQSSLRMLHDGTQPWMLLTLLKD